MDAEPPPNATSAVFGRYAELLPHQMDAIMARYPIAYVPSGTLEWHSYHLPLGLDGIVAEGLCLRAAQRAGGVLVPATYWAIGGVPFPYTTRVRPEVVEALYVGILEQLSQVGFACAIVVAGHYGIDHVTALKRAALQVMERGAIAVLALADYELVADLGWHGGDHAGALETSLLWAMRPELVAMHCAPPTGTLDGVIGEDPRLGASQARGQVLLDAIVDRLATLSNMLLEDRSPARRSALNAALAAQIAVLETIRRDRAMRPRALVRPLFDEPYLRCLDCFRQGDFDGARLAAEEALLLLARHEHGDA
jgi:creatinine amidohydrolase